MIYLIKSNEDVDWATAGSVDETIGDKDEFDANSNNEAKDQDSNQQDRIEKVQFNQGFLLFDFKNFDDLVSTHVDH